MTNQQKFQLHVYLAAVQRDFDLETNDAQWIAAYAHRIPKENIPPHPANAAQVFLRFVGGRRGPLKWMMAEQTCGLKRSREEARAAKHPNIIRLVTSPD